MQVWWNSLTLLERVFACAAIPATLLLVLQLVLSLLGLAGQDGDTPEEFDDPDGPEDLDGPDDLDDFDDLDEPDGAEPGLRLFTFRGIVTFFAVYGWAALAVSRAGLPWLMAVAVGALLGGAAMLLTALVFRMMLRLQADGTIDLKNAVGLPGEVYLSIPAARQGCGKVSVVIQESLTECAAVTDGGQLPTGSAVTVIGVTRDGELLVMGRQAP